MKLICAWCEKEGKPCLMAEVEPLADDSTSHGMCGEHRRELEERLRQRKAAMVEKLDELTRLIDQVDP